MLTKVVGLSLILTEGDGLKNIHICMFLKSATL